MGLFKGLALRSSSKSGAPSQSEFGGTRRTARRNISDIEAAGRFAEEQLNPYMLDPSVMGELNAIATGKGNFRDNPLYRQYMDVGRESMMEDMAGTGSLYSGVRMEGMRDLGQSAFGNYLGMLQGLAGFGRETAGQMGNIRMGTTGNTTGLRTQATQDIQNLKMAKRANEANLAMAAIGAGATMMTGMPIMPPAPSGGSTYSRNIAASSSNPYGWNPSQSFNQYGG